MAEEDWEKADISIPEPKFKDEDVPEEKKTLKPPPKKEKLAEKSEERQRKLVLSDDQMRQITEKYMHLPKNEREQKIEQEVNNLLVQHVFTDVLKIGEKLGGKEDFVQLANSVGLVIRNSGKEYFVPTFVEELLNNCKPGLSYEQLKSIVDIAVRISNEKYQEERRKGDKKKKGTQATLKAGKGIAVEQRLAKALLPEEPIEEPEVVEEEYDYEEDFM